MRKPVTTKAPAEQVVKDIRWKRWTGHHVRSRIEAKMPCMKAFGERIAARHPDSQTAEIQIRVALMNRFSALGTAEIVRVGL